VIGMHPRRTMLKETIDPLERDCVYINPTGDVNFDQFTSFKYRILLLDNVNDESSVET
jgi:hypothetical protein